MTLPPEISALSGECGIVIVGTLVSACGDECREYSKYTCEQIERGNYNAYFYFPDGEEKYLGNVDGLNSCSIAAANYAQQTGAPKS